MATVFAALILEGEYPLGQWLADASGLGASWSSPSLWWRHGQIQAEVSAGGHDKRTSKADCLTGEIASMSKLLAEFVERSSAGQVLHPCVPGPEYLTQVLTSLGGGFPKHPLQLKSWLQPARYQAQILERPCQSGSCRPCATQIKSPGRSSRPYCPKMRNPGVLNLILRELGAR
jgi:hypothetical protein